MKKILLILFFAPLFFFAQEKLTLEDVWVKYSFYPKSAQGFNVMNDGLHYVDVAEENNSTTLSQFELKSGKKIKDLVKGSDLTFNGKNLDINTYQYSPNEDKLLLFEGMESIYRRSAKANYYIYDIASKKTIQLSDKGKQMFPLFSPDGKKVAFVRDNNIFIKTIDSGTETQVTTDGEMNKIKNGWADWVYEEEFSKADYFDWSSNSQYLAYVKFNESNVKEYTIDFYRGELYPEKYTFKYPKAGEDNSIVSVHIYDEINKKTVTADIGTNKDIYIPRIQFTNNPLVLSIQRLNRLQNKLELLFTDVIGGKGIVAYTDESKTYIDITDDLTFVGTKGFIISSERDNYNHLYYYDLTGKLINQVTKGNWDVMEFKGYDEKSNTLFYSSTENGAINRDVYSIKLNG
ncbi:MAG: beta-propeller domain-containing protein, partial [Bacteroidia bacterium]